MHTSEELNVVEILTHIRRFCRWKGLTYEELDEAAHNCSSKEASEELPNLWWLDAPDPRRGRQKKRDEPHARRFEE